jgi:two-component system, NarL family, sensor histidine kinase DevS
MELRGLLEVGRTLVSDLDVESVLRRVLETARDLTRARYAALGILDQSRQELERFLFVGIDDETRRAIGPLPRGRGVLGELIRRPEPLRLADVAHHPRSYGFPPGHPPMTSFLGVPIAIRGEAFGNLYLTDKAGGEQFSAADEELVIVLADWAAIAIDNARLYQDVENRRRELERAVRGLEATATVVRAVGFETDLERVLDVIVEHGRALVDARSLLVLLEEPTGLRVARAAGEIGEDVRRVRLRAEGTLAGSVLSTGTTARVPSLADRVGHGLDALTGGATSALVAPLGFRGHARGVLIALDRDRDPPVFDADDEHLLSSFAASAAIAIATAQSVEAERRRLSVLAAEAERKRWARDLHDETLQELSALKLQLESRHRSGRLEAMTEATRRALDQLQLTIEGLQNLITDLRPAALDELGVKPALEALVARTAASSGLDIQARIDIAFDAGRAPTRLSGEVESAVYRLVQEGLTNAVKHAGAERAWVEVIEADGRISVSQRRRRRLRPGRRRRRVRPRRDAGARGAGRGATADRFRARQGDHGARRASRALRERRPRTRAGLEAVISPRACPCPARRMRDASPRETPTSARREARSAPSRPPRDAGRDTGQASGRRSCWAATRARARRRPNPRRDHRPPRLACTAASIR